MTTNTPTSKPVMPQAAYEFLEFLAGVKQEMIQKGIPMSAYNGYTESDEKVKSRWEARKRRHEEAMRLREEAERQQEAIPVLVTAEIRTLELAE